MTTVRRREPKWHRGATVVALIVAVAVWLGVASVVPSAVGQYLIIALTVIVPVTVGLLCAVWAPHDTSDHPETTDKDTHG